jgi:hypothetical protein
MRKCNDTYKEVRTFTFPNCTARVYFPDISDEERQRRMKRIEQAAANLLKGTLKNGIHT